MKPSPQSDLPRRRRRVLVGARSRKSGASSSGARSGPATPLLRWKHDGPHGSAQTDTGAEPVIPSASARKLAAAIWKLGFEPSPSNLQKLKVYNQLRTINHGKTKDDLHCYISHENEIYAESPHSTAETATKWDSEPHQTFFQQKLLEYKPDIAVATSTSSIQAELDEARARVSKLEAERRHTKKKLDHFLRRVAEEKALWRSREHEKIRTIMEAVKDDLSRERKNRHRLEILNSKLVDELAEAKLSAKRYLQDYEKERKARELMEEVCDELAKEIADDKAEVEALKRETLKSREEIEEERKMLQMAEVWREERVQMKLLDAKLALENKYKELTELQTHLEAFIRGNWGHDVTKDVAREAEILMEAVSRAKVRDMKEFSYQRPRSSEDIFSVFEELRPQEDMHEREIEECRTNGECNSPDTDIFLEKPAKRVGNGSSNEDEEIEDESGWETVSNLDQHGSSNSLEGSEPSVNNRIYKSNNASVSGTGSGTDWDETSEVCSTNARHYKKKGSSIMKLWRSSNGEDCRKISGEISNGRVSNASNSPGLKSHKMGSGSPVVLQWNSPDSVNRHVARSVNGCIEWPRGVQKQSLKSKLMEARVEGKKVQLKHALKQQI
ncbi:actin cytoskeleton-regulatory complex pan-like protein [Rhynchospora pubera]|uniref:Actin cytoskeleton-regulatory complex pan-like protein n=1 Tax=Rhynchospora pubera TaxID=906938 RepID=A0AAV8CK89_9POAL|nr:actin cytoskeleton-regulatory complex pan-like protein [Rhynchospora pubera]